MTESREDAALSPSTLDPPTLPSPVDDDTEDHAPLQPGRMFAGWRLAYFVGFGLAIAAAGAVWAVATQIGHTTWWMGPAGDPNLLAVQLLPFYVPFFVILNILANRPGVSFIGAFAGVGEVVIGVIDLGYYLNLGLLEIAIGVSMVAVALASRAGVVRHGDHDGVGPGGSEAGSGR